jgi:hypothetical protein
MGRDTTASGPSARLIAALEDAFTVLRGNSNTPHDEDGLPVTFLESRRHRGSSTATPSPSLPLETLIRARRQP